MDEESLRQEEDNKLAYPKQEEGLVEYLHKCQRKISEVMLYPRCNSVFDRKAVENLEGVRLAKKGRNWRDPRNNQAFDARRDPRRGDQRGLTLQVNRPLTFRPTTDAPKDRWVKPVEGKGQGHHKWKKFEVERGSSIAHQKEFQASKQLMYHSKNYKGKNSMSRS